MNDLSTNVNTEWLSMEEAAALKGVTKSAISHALKKYPSVKEKYTKRDNRKLYLSKEGYMVLFNVQNKRQGGLNDNECALTANSEIKQRIAERAIDFSKDPIIAMRMMQLQTQEHVDKLEQKMLMLETNVEEKLDPAQKLTASQRKYLNERVRSYSIHTEIPYWKVWTMVHEHTGAHTIGKYNMEDYDVAVAWLKKQYKLQDLPW